MNTLMSARSLCLAACLLLPWPVAAQSAPSAEPTDQETEARQAEERLSTLHHLLESIAELELEVQQAELDHQDAETDDQKNAISEQVAELTARIGDLESDFDVLASGIDRELFFEEPTDEFNWKAEVAAIFAPVITELKQASAHPRELEALRSELALYEKRLPALEEALASLHRLKERSDDEAVSQRLAELIEFWTLQRDEHTSHFEAVEQRLEEKESAQVGIHHAAGEILRIFFRQRLVNLLFALLAFAGIFFSLRYLHRLVHKYLPSGGTHSRQLFIRLADIAYYLFTVLLAVGALLVVLYLSADWVLLTIAVLVLIGVAWAARNAVPVFLEQAKLLLNVGAVREGERIVYKGIPWQVASLSMFSELENPALRGGTYRLPLKDLVGLRSRQAEEDEPWFPSRISDWVILGDGTYGEIVEQTPETVVVATVRGSYKHYPTVDYLQQHPKNLSSNFFAVPHTVSLDYRYRDIVNTEIVDKMKKTIEEGFRREFYGEFLDRVIVELKQMGASSLDVITIARFRGGAASEYTEIGWKIQQLALDACNENGWEIPFPQLTIHQQRELG